MTAGFLACGSPGWVDHELVLERRPLESRSPDDGDSLDLVRRVQRGDTEAFRQLLDQHHARTFHLVQGILGDWHLSEDVTQEVFATVFRKASSFREASLFSTWLFRIAVNAALRARRRWRRHRTEALDDAGEVPSTAPHFTRPIENEEVFRKLLQPLPEKLRVPIVLREAGGLSYEEIAEVLGCTRGAVEQRIHRAMVRLRELWKDHEDRFRQRE